MASTIVSLKRDAEVLISKLHCDCNDVDITTLRRDFKSLFAELQAECTDRSELWETNCESLVEVFPILFTLVETCMESIGSLAKKIATCKQEIIEFREELATSKQQIIEFRKELARSKQHTVQLLWGQVAYDVDGAIAHYVLDPLIGDQHYISNVKGMELAIEGTAEHYKNVFGTEEKRRKAGDRWKAFQKDPEWSDMLYLLIKKLKSSRNTVAHPITNRRDIENAMAEVPGPQKREYRNLKKLHDKLC